MTSNIVLIEDIISVTILIVASLIVLIRFLKRRRQNQFLLLLALTLLCLGAFINILENTNYPIDVNQFEDILSVLFLPVLIFSIYNNIIKKELDKRKISEQKFKGIFNQTYSFIGLLEPSGTILEANSTSLDFSRQGIDDLYGKHFSETIWWKHSKDEQEKVCDAIERARKGEVVRFETNHVDVYGQIHWIDFTLKPVFDDNQNIIYLIHEGRDITEIKLARIELENHKENLEVKVQERTEELQAANEEIRAINEEIYKKNQVLENALQKLKEAHTRLVLADKMSSLGILTAGVAHEINNPLNFIQGGYMGLKKYFEKTALSDETPLILLSHINEGINRASAIVASLNQFSRTKDVFNETCRIHNIIDNCLLMLNNQIKNNIEIKKQYSTKSFHVQGNVGKLHQVFVNIFTNAIQAIEKEGTISIITEIENGLLTIHISDTGSGINKKDLPKIFDMFYTTKDVGIGTGLGLSICYSIILDHKGTLEIDSDEGKGTTVIIALPVTINESMQPV